MDPDVSVMFTVPGLSLIRRSDTIACLSSEFNRKQLDIFDVQIESIWEKRRRENPKLFNGTKFRLHSVSEDSHHNSPDGRITFNLGVTCYRDFISTNWAPNAKEILQRGKQDHNNSQAFMSDAMGVGALVQTIDNHVIFLKRSIHCGEAKGLWDIPGGHAEPQELVGKLPVENIDVTKLDPVKVIEEMFDSIKREVIDEVNIPHACLSEPELCGIARNTTAAGRPSVEFVIRCSLNAEEVKAKYRQGNQSEADESTNICLLPFDEVIEMKSGDDFWQNMAPSAKGCIVLYRLYYRKIMDSRHSDQE
ncbi:uridine diphosphate glucose pyrophosphatase NUDT22-like [Ylistrum balloti]|uniref:uridine diphosphate glucose pyrophosphatase NUDT22-like n=1 Tax=Ylistrum balloti TaxID=509963 RepID=UPI002905ADC9|nr:uridine diphosphate glucose pyrophosphatase NUDT22-like [Ylistrum balloti]